MPEVNRLRLLLPRPVRELPADLVAVITLVLVTDLVVLAPVLSETPLRVVLGLPLVLFLPGYAFVAALFPEAGEAPDEESSGVGGAANDSGAEVNAVADGPAAGRGIDGIERVALSFGLSIAIVPLLGLVLNFTPWGIRLVPVLVSVSGFTLLATAVGARRRRALPPDERFRVPYRAWFRAGRAELFAPETRTDAVLNILLIMSVLLAVGSVGYAVAVPKQGESFTELYLLTENESGELVADNYPTNVSVGESRSLVVGIGNHEHRTVEYTLVVELQRVRVANNSTTVLESRELDRFRTTLADNETWQRQHTITPSMVGERLRLVYLLYRGEPSGDPSVESAYREVHLWLTVSLG